MFVFYVIPLQILYLIYDSFLSKKYAVRKVYGGRRCSGHLSFEVSDTHELGFECQYYVPIGCLFEVHCVCTGITFVA